MLVVLFYSKGSLLNFMFILYFFIWISYTQTNRTQKLESPGALNVQETPSTNKKTYLKNNFNKKI